MREGIEDKFDISMKVYEGQVYSSLCAFSSLSTFASFSTWFSPKTKIKKRRIYEKYHNRNFERVKKKIMKAETSNHHHHLRWHQEIDKFFKQRLSEERKCRLYLDISHRVHTLIFHTCFLNERGYLGGGCLY